MDDPPKVSSAVRFLCVLVFVIGAPGCTFLADRSPAATVYVPETAGIVVSIDTSGPAERYELADGRSISMPAGAQVLGKRDPAVGFLLLSGMEPTAWLRGAWALDPKPVPEPADCYVLIGETRTDDTHVFITVEDHADGDSAIELPKAVEWRDVEYFKRADGSDILLGVFNCLNQRGQVTEHRFGQ